MQKTKCRKNTNRNKKTIKKHGKRSKCIKKGGDGFFDMFRKPTLEERQRNREEADRKQTEQNITNMIKRDKEEKIKMEAIRIEEERQKKEIPPLEIIKHDTALDKLATVLQNEFDQKANDIEKEYVTKFGDINTNAANYDELCNRLTWVSNNRLPNKCGTKCEIKYLFSKSAQISSEYYNRYIRKPFNDKMKKYVNINPFRLRLLDAVEENPFDLPIIKAFWAINQIAKIMVKYEDKINKNEFTLTNLFFPLTPEELTDQRKPQKERDGEQEGKEIVILQISLDTELQSKFTKKSHIQYTQDFINYLKSDKDNTNHPKTAYTQAQIDGFIQDATYTPVEIKARYELDTIFNCFLGLKEDEINEWRGCC